MSRVAKKPVDLPQGVSATIGADAVTVKGSKGSLTLALKSGIKVELQGQAPRGRGQFDRRGAECHRGRDARAPREHGHGRDQGL